MPDPRPLPTAMRAITSDTDVADDDKVLTYGDVRVLVDSSSAVMLEGATLDFKDGLESGFSINNPNAQRTCGCGSSFS